MVTYTNKTFTQRGPNIKTDGSILAELIDHLKYNNNRLQEVNTKVSELLFRVLGDAWVANLSPPEDREPTDHIKGMLYEAMTEQDTLLGNLKGQMVRLSEIA